MSNKPITDMPSFPYLKEEVASAILVSLAHEGVHECLEIGFGCKGGTIALISNVTRFLRNNMRHQRY